MNSLNDNDIIYAGHPEQTPQPEFAPAPKPKPPRDPFKIFKIVIIVCVVVGVLAVAVYVVVSTIAKSTVTEKIDDPTPVDNSSVKSLTAEQTIKNVNVYFKGAEKAKSSITTPVKAKNKNFYTVVPDLDQVESLAGFVPAENSISQRESIEKSMDYDGFTKKVFSEGDGAGYLADFTRDDVTCQLSVDVSQREENGDWMEIRCLDAEVYAEYAEAQQPLVSTYTPITTSGAEYGFVGKPEPKNGALANYKLVEIQVSTVIDQRMSADDNLGMFYQTPDGLWHYFQDHSRGVLIVCTVYSTTALKMAYADQPCQPVAGSSRNTVLYSGKR